jgi:hypothetical protein
MDLSEITNEGVWRNEGYKEEFPFLTNLGFQTLTVEYVPVKCAYDENLSTSFQMRHIVNADGKRGFMSYVSKRFLHMKETYGEGTTQEVYDEVMKWGVAFQQEELRLVLLNLDRK